MRFLASIGLIALAVPQSNALAQSLTILLQDMDPVPGGGGTIARVTNPVVNDSGEWVVECVLFTMDVDADRLVVENGAALFVEGQPATSPPGALWGNVRSIALNAAGETALVMSLQGVPANQDRGVYFGTTLVLQEGAPAPAPLPYPGTFYSALFDVEMNDDRQVLLHASITSPGNGTWDSLVMLALDASGAIVSEELLQFEEASAEYPTGLPSYALNNAGHYIYTEFLSAASDENELVLIDDVAVAREGDILPLLGGHEFGALLGNSVHLANTGEFVYVADLMTSPRMIIKNGTTKLAREGDTFPAIAPGTLHAVTDLDAPQINDRGEVLWKGTFGPLNRDGLFLDHELIVQQGVTAVGGGVVAGLSGTLAMSPNGRYILFDATLSSTGRDALLLLDRGPLEGPIGTQYCFGDGSQGVCPCKPFWNDPDRGAPQHGCPNSKTSAGAILCAQRTANLSFAQVRCGGLPLGSVATLLRSPTSLSSGASFGDGLLCLPSTRAISLKAPSVSVDGGARFNVPVHAPGTSVAYQVIYRDLQPNHCTSETHNASNALSITW
jgi:hypothetical protein